MQTRMRKEYRARYRGGPDEGEWSPWFRKLPRRIAKYRQEFTGKDGIYIGTYVLAFDAYQWKAVEPKTRKRQTLE